MNTDLKELEKKYDLKLERVVETIKCIKKKNPKILIQLPDGFKPYATRIVDYLEEQVSKQVQISIWFGSCFGACDVPDVDADLIVQLGHAPWK